MRNKGCEESKTRRESNTGTMRRMRRMGIKTRKFEVGGE